MGRGADLGGKRARQGRGKRLRPDEVIAGWTGPFLYLLVSGSVNSDLQSISYHSLTTE